MPSKLEFYKIVLKKTPPAIVLALFIFISLMFVIEYTDAFYLVILVWIIVPVLFVKVFRWIQSKLKYKE